MLPTKMLALRDEKFASGFKKEEVNILACCNASGCLMLRLTDRQIYIFI